MTTSARIGLALGGFYLVAGVVYYLTGHQWLGFPLLLMAAVGTGLIAFYALLAVRRAERELAGGGARREQAEPHVGPTIWPFGFALASVALVIGMLAARWVLVVGGVLFIGAAVGWFADVRRQWRQPGGGQPPGHGQPRPPGHGDAPGAGGHPRQEAT